MEEAAHTNATQIQDIMLMNAEERIPVRTLLNVFGRNLPSVFFDTTLDNVLKGIKAIKNTIAWFFINLFPLVELKAGQSHIALVRRVVEPENGQGSFISSLVKFED